MFKIVLFVIFLASQLIFSQNQPQTITFAPISNKTCLDSVITMSATASSGLPVIFNLKYGNAILQNNKLTILGVGTVIIEGIQSGDQLFNPASNVTRNFEVVTDFYSKANGNSILNFRTFHCDNEKFVLSSPYFPNTKYEWQTADSKRFDTNIVERPPFSTSVSGFYNLTIKEGFCTLYNIPFEIKILSTTGFTINEPPAKIFDDAEPVVLKTNVPDTKIWIANSEQTTIDPAELGIGSHTITYVLKSNDNYCTRIEKRVVEVIENKEIFVYELVTPSSETNKYFFIKNIIKNPNSLVSVFSKSGQTIFEKLNYQNDWNPKELPSGAYYYSISFPEKNNEIKKGLIYISN